MSSSNSPIPAVVLASGRGSNFSALVEAQERGDLPELEIRALLSNKKDAPVLDRARDFGIPAVHVEAVQKELGESLEARRERFDTRVLEVLSEFGPRFLILAGYMKILSPRLIGAFRDPGSPYSRIVNVHPSLLPAFPGREGYAQAFFHGCSVAGVTIHLVNDGVDDGPICVQKAFSIADCQSVAEVEKRGLSLEHELYPRALRWILKENFKIEERKSADQKRRFCVRQG